MSRERLAKLKEDFTYNLRLLEERDAELERYDAAFASLRAALRDKESEASELRIAAAEAAHAVAHEREASAEAGRKLEAAVARGREEAEAIRWKREDELQDPPRSTEIRRDPARCAVGWKR